MQRLLRHTCTAPLMLRRMSSTTESSTTASIDRQKLLAETAATIHAHHNNPSMAASAIVARFEQEHATTVGKTVQSLMRENAVFATDLKWYRTLSFVNTCVWLFYVYVRV